MVAIMGVIAIRGIAARYFDEGRTSGCGWLFRVSNEARKQFSDLGRGKLTLARAFVNSLISHLSLSLDLLLGGGVGARSTSSSS